MRHFKKVFLIIIVSVLLTMACNRKNESLLIESQQKKYMNSNQQTEAPFEGWVEGLPKIKAPSGFNWRQFEGVKLRMISENTPPSTALAANIGQFEKVTGITVQIEQTDLNSVIEKVSLDFNAKAGEYQLIYADPYQILANHSAEFEDLYKFNSDQALPQIPGGLSDFIQSQLEVDGYMGNKENLLALPYDAPTMVLAYRKDVFQKYQKLFMQEMGYDWTPGENLTWNQYYEIGKWINNKIASGVITEVTYGIGHQAKKHDSLMNDFSNILAANGGDYFERGESGRIGTLNPAKTTIKTETFLQSAQFYKKLMNIAAPNSINWDWLDVANEFSEGTMAMSPQWHEYSTLFEDMAKSKVAGKVGWAVLPKGDIRRAHTFGGTGIGINKYATSDEKKAAWLFLIWATSPQSQYMILKSKDGGSTPTRYSVYGLPDVKRGMQAGTLESKAMPNLLPMKATLKAWEDANIYVRPKIPQWRQVDTFIFTELSNMLTDKQSPQKAIEQINEKVNRAIGN